MSEAPFTFQGRSVLTLRQIDRLNGVVKGAAFRAFKQVRASLVEGRDFFVLSVDAPATAEEAALLERLHAAAALYSSSRVAVLITSGAYARMQRAANLGGR